MVLSGERLGRSCERGAGRQLHSKESSRDKMATGEEDEKVNVAEATRSRNRQLQEEHHEEQMQHDEKRPAVDYAASIEKVKDCGWSVELFNNQKSFNLVVPFRNVACHVACGNADSRGMTANPSADSCQLSIAIILIVFLYSLYISFCLPSSFVFRRVQVLGTDLWGRGGAAASA